MTNQLTEVDMLSKCLCILITLLLSGCAKTETSLLPPKTQAGLTYGRVVTIILDDGTRCAAIDNYYGTGIDCDWQPRKAE